jgi:signal transduction histidine kinase
MTITNSLTNDELIAELRLRISHGFSNNRSPDKDCADEVARLSTKLTASERCKSQFLSNVRNEINNPLTSILGLASSIRGLSPSEKVHQLSTMIYDQAFDLDFQMRNIIAAAEIESGDLAPLSARINVADLLQDQVTYLQSRIDQKRINVKLEIEDALRFRTDGYLLQTICVNLIANAIEYSSRNKSVIIAANQVGENLLIQVIDFGIGIDQEQQELIFERFHQADAGGTKLHRGHGLGLTVARQLVQLLGGKLSLHSTSGYGTTVKIELPPLSEDKNFIGASGSGNELLFSGGEEF